MATTDQVRPVGDGARERILEAAYTLFSRHGTRAVGIDRIIAEAGIAKMTLYRHFASKEELILAFLELREERWTRDWLQAEVMSRGTTPAERLLAIFDVFGEWFASPEYDRCAFVTTLLEVEDREHAVHRASVEHLANIRDFLKGLLKEARVKDPDHVARQWHILMKGSIVAAAEGDHQAAARARELGALLLERHGVAV
jgi:AcrR family transcriptional regulator